MNVIFGCITDSNLDDKQEIHVTVVATGIDNNDPIIDNDQVYNGHNQTTNYFDDKSREYSDQKDENQDSVEKIKDEAIEKNEDRYRLDFKSEKPEKSEDSMLKFGDDDIDIPTFLRNSN